MFECLVFVGGALVGLVIAFAAEGTAHSRLNGPRSGAFQQAKASTIKLFPSNSGMDVAESGNAAGDQTSPESEVGVEEHATVGS